MAICVNVMHSRCEGSLKPSWKTHGFEAMKIPSSEWSRRVLWLYRQLLKQGKTLQYTEYDFFRRIIRREFDQQRDEVETRRIKEQYEVRYIKQKGKKPLAFFFLIEKKPAPTKTRMMESPYLKKEGNTKESGVK